MKTISILVPEHGVMQAIADPKYLFNTINEFLVLSGKQPLFDVELVGASKEIKVSDGQFSIHVDKLLNEVGHTDLIFVPAVFGDMKKVIEANKSAYPWIRERYESGAEVASLCVGAFLLAATGLLDGKKCSTHWGFTNEFKSLYPNVDVIDGSIVTEESGIYSSGGANSYWNLLLHLVEKYTDRQTAILASKYFAIDIDRDSQAAFAMFQAQKEHNDAEVKNAQDYIEENVHERITIDELADKFGVGRRTFERRFKLATNNSVLEYIQRIKIEAAKRSFENSRNNINEVMYNVGYTDTKAFRTIFKKLTGLTPIEYRNKYNKQALN